MTMTILKLAVGTLALGLAGSAMAIDPVIPTLGAAMGLPLEGGILMLAVAGLVAGIRLIQRKNKR